MITTHDPAIDDCAAAVSNTFTGVFHMIETWRSAVEALATQTNGSMNTTHVDALVESLVVPHLSAPNALIIGAGFVASPGLLADSEWHLAWWLGHSNTFRMGTADPSIRRLYAVEDSAADNFRDYTTLEWWRVPASTRSPHITGPYVDYLCTDDYTLTLTVPVLIGDRLIGVTGADIYVNDIERLLLPHVRAIGRTATVVNSSGRVVVSTDSQRPTGSLLREYADGMLVSPSQTVLRCTDTNLSLVVDAP
ncbi:MAG: cache domain-containing protein [Microbacteriaceae bacterium]